jgi:adenylosuccinate lyase
MSPPCSPLAPIRAAHGHKTPAGVGKRMKAWYSRLSGSLNFESYKHYRPKTYSAIQINYQIKTMNYTHDTFLSPFTWRYGSSAMRAIWSEAHKRRTWRRVWVALAEAQAAAGLVSAEQVADLHAHADDVDIDAAHEIEKTTRHDLMAEIRVYADQCKIGGGIIHLGATSMDIEDNADAIRLREALDVMIAALRTLLEHTAAQIEKWADTPTMAFTHLQPAEPTTIGYRLAQFGQDLLMDWRDLVRVRNGIRGKGIKGAVGTSASYAQLLLGTELSPAQLEARIMNALRLPVFTVATQTYPRKQDYHVATVLASLAGSLYKFAFDLRLLQSPPIGEWSEGFAAGQVGSSAMPFKRNPINAEKVDSLGRLVAQLAGTAWDNAAHSLLERTLDDSANRREMLPVLFLATEEMLITISKIIGSLHIDEAAVRRTLDRYGTFAATERLLMELVKAGANRQEMHHVLRDHSMAAWVAIQDGGANPLADALGGDEAITRYVPAESVRQLLHAADYVGDAPQRARQLASEIALEISR